MHTSVNISNDSHSLAPFADAAALRGFYEKHGCDGVELILCGDDFTKLEPGMVRGLHLIFYPEWISLWHDELDYLDREFGSREAWQSFYACKNGAGLIDIYRNELATAKRLGAEYVVFHMGDNALDEYFTLRPRYSPARQADESCAFLNELFDGGGWDFALLLENMWLGCMNLTDPELTRRALAGVRYPNTGLMLDTGHLMATEPSLKTPEEGCAYVRYILKSHGDMAKRVRGVHLHQSLSGAYASTLPLPPPKREAGYLARYAEATAHLQKIDRHRPIVAHNLPGLIQSIAPTWLCHELYHGPTLETWDEALAAQAAALLETTT